jgi:hypothetical protein
MKMGVKDMNHMEYYENYNFENMSREDLVQEILRLNWFADKTLAELDKFEKVNETLMKKHPAFKENINVDDIMDKLVAGESLTKIGKCYGCDKKTIKNRLYREQYTDRDIAKLRQGVDVRKEDWFNNGY